VSSLKQPAELKTKMHQSTKDRAESLSLLTPRLAINQKCQDRDFQSWLVSRLSVQTGESVLDLACGNGAQARYFDKRIGSSGYLRCVDIHEPSIASLKTEINSGNERDFIVSDMMNFSNYLDANRQYTLAHCSFALPYASSPALVIEKLASSIQKPLGRLAISLPCKPHGMFEFAKSMHAVPDTVEPAIELAEAHCIGLFRELFGEVDVSYFNSNLCFTTPEDFMDLYRNTTYYSQEHDHAISAAINSRIDQDGLISFKKSAILIIGRDLA